MKRSLELKNAIRKVDDIINDERVKMKRIKADYERAVVRETARDIVKRFQGSEVPDKNEDLYIELVLNEMLTKLKEVDN